MNFDEISQTLKNSKERMNSADINLKNIEREIKYKYLCSFYSLAYLSGSIWYLGKSIKEYKDNKHLKTMFKRDYKLEYVYYILDNNLFPNK